MPDLVVDTGAQRLAAADLRSEAPTAAAAAHKGGRLAVYVPRRGHRAAEALSGFLGEWTYGMGGLATRAEVLAGYLEASANAFDGVESRLVSAVGGDMAQLVSVANSSSSPIPSVAPPPTAPSRHLANWAGLGPPPGFMQPTLATATHFRQLVPGEPDDVDALAAAEVRNFAVAADDACSALRRMSTGTWQGQAAAMFSAHVDEVPKQLDDAARCFGAAADALRRFAIELAYAQDRARVALDLFTDARLRLTEAEAAGAGGSADQARADIARASSTLNLARADVEAAGRALAEVLDEAGDVAPDKPGFLASLGRALSSFASGAGEGTVGMVTGVVEIGKLAVKLNPSTAMTDPVGYLKTLHGVLDGATYLATHPVQTGKVLLDWDTWAEDPARAAGRLAPELLLTIATAGAGAGGRPRSPCPGRGRRRG